MLVAGTQQLLVSAAQPLTALPVLLFEALCKPLLLQVVALQGSLAALLKLVAALLTLAAGMQQQLVSEAQPLIAVPVLFFEALCR